MRLAELMLWLDRLAEIPPASELEGGIIGVVGIATAYSDPRRRREVAAAGLLATRAWRNLLGVSDVDPLIGPHDAPVVEVAPLRNPQLLLQRLKRSLTNAGAPNDVVQGLFQAAGELVDNVDEHSGTDSSAPALMAYSIAAGEACFAIADAGMGAYAGLQPVIHIANARDALHACVIAGKSRKPYSVQGHGLRTVQKRIIDKGGELAFRSDDAVITMDGSTDDETRRVRIRRAPPVRGFFAAGRLSWRAA